MILHRLMHTRMPACAAYAVLAVSPSMLVDGQIGPEGPSFEVASIRPAASPFAGPHIENTADTTLRATSVSLRFLVQTAYKVEDFQISGGPGWTRSDRFDISARSDQPGQPEQPQAARLRERIRRLLAARFQLSVREEIGEGAVYFLEQTRSGSKLNPPASDRPGIGRNRGLIAAENASVAMLAKTLSNALLRPVPDQTGLSGNYAFRLEWAEAGAPGEPEDSGVSLFTAIQEQLGLRLRSGRGPIRLIYIDRAEKPSAN
jgi:uncharacterized protein (TIGR03435 family)